MITAVVGAQYGSEGKGKVVEHLAQEYDVFVRVGGPNAGHVVYYRPEDGDPIKFTMRSVPCGWLNFDAKLVIGAGAIINIDVLEKELSEIEKYDPMIRKRLYIDPNVMVITDENIEVEEQLMERIGSTGEGVGQARAERMGRDAKLAKDYSELERYIIDTPKFIHNHRALNIMLEGTQGSGLSLIHGDYPYCTSHDTNVSQMLADIGLPPQALDATILVVRSYPIRVGGNSGPLSREISFEELEPKLGPRIEYTSVTKKVRRIGMLDMEKLERAAMLNAPTHFAFMFADYVDPENEGVTDVHNLSDKTLRLVDAVSTVLGAQPLFISTGVHSMIRLSGF